MVATTPATTTTLAMSAQLLSLFIKRLSPSESGPGHTAVGGVAFG